MNRRAYLRRLVRRPESPSVSSLAGFEIGPQSGLDAYQGPWEYEQAAHLLRRCTFGPTMEEIDLALEWGFEATLDALFADRPLPDPPINYDFMDDPNVPIGATWLDAPYDEEVNLRGYRKRSLYAWTFDQLLKEGISIREKLTLFWHNHFAVGNVNDPKYLYRYVSLLRTNAWGNFRDLVKAVTIDPAMLRFLNGNQNTNRAPNENYARELLELYTVGKGALAGPGDYSTFTEDDVLSIARVLTGWKDKGFYSKDPEEQIEVRFIPEKHDTELKQLSHRFNNEIITNKDESEYEYLIDLIFQQRVTATYICKKLYRWFVYYEIDEEVESTVIEPLADILIANDFEIKPTLLTLLSSEHFFDILSQGPLIKNPLDFIISSLKQTYVAFPEAVEERLFVLNKFYGTARLMQMEYYLPPDVAGWGAYYREPQYYRTWINATTLGSRMNYTDSLTSSRGHRFAGIRVASDPFKIIEKIEDSIDPNEVVRGFAKVLFPLPLTDSQYDALKEILIPGLPDFEWSAEFGEYQASPEDSDLAKSIETKLRNLLQVMLSMAEFNLS